MNHRRPEQITYLTIEMRAVRWRCPMPKIFCRIMELPANLNLLVVHPNPLL